VEDLAVENEIPSSYLVQILIDLKAGHIVKSQRGKEGGYRLARPPAEITFAQVIECIHGPLFDSPALYDRGCPPELRAIWQRLAKAVQNEATAVNFQQLADQSSAGGAHFDI